MTAQRKSARSNLPALPRFWRRPMPWLAALLLVGLSACSTTSVSYPIPPANCSKRVPESIKRPVPGWPFPAGDAPQDWQAFGVGESGQRVQANERGNAVLDVMAACEAREAEIYQALTKRRKVMGIF